MPIFFDRPAFGGGVFKMEYDDGGTPRTKLLKPTDKGKQISLESPAAEADAKNKFPEFMLPDQAALTAKKNARKNARDNNRKVVF